MFFILTWIIGVSMYTKIISNNEVIGPYPSGTKYGYTPDSNLVSDFNKTNNYWIVPTSGYTFSYVWLFSFADVIDLKQGFILRVNFVNYSQSSLLYSIKNVILAKNLAQIEKCCSIDVINFSPVNSGNKTTVIFSDNKLMITDKIYFGMSLIDQSITPSLALNNISLEIELESNLVAVMPDIFLINKDSSLILYFDRLTDCDRINISGVIHFGVIERNLVIFKLNFSQELNISFSYYQNGNFVNSDISIRVISNLSRDIFQPKQDDVRKTITIFIILLIISICITSIILLILIFCAIIPLCITVVRTRKGKSPPGEKSPSVELSLSHYGNTQEINRQLSTD